MAKGLEKHQEYLKAISLLGKPLARRSGSKCELCSGSGLKLGVFEIPPAPKEPDMEHSLFLCETCQDGLKHSKKLDAHHWRCLQEAIWSDLPGVQVMALRLLRRLAVDHAWAQETLDEAFVDDEVSEWAEQAGI